jgi:uncharacterized protein (TIGR02600 family)
MTHPGEGVPVTSTVFSPPYNTSPPDHLWMDLFWMPIAEPYAISEPMSTEGKVNLNYQIVPFTYIKRATALRAALASEKVAEVGMNQAAGYKGGGYEQGVALNTTSILLPKLVPARYPIDLDATTSQFDYKFSQWDIFRSASQICEEFLVPMDIPNSLPNGTSAQCISGSYQETITPQGNYPLPASFGDTTGAKDFAKDWYLPVTSSTTVAPFAMVADNVREQPYAHMYGKVTTKSNTFTVYYRVQVLKTPPSVNPATWDETRGGIAGEYRGSTTLERFIDANDSSVPDPASSGSMPTSNLEGYYKWRVVENRQFSP